jgi:hypothetical protein
VTDTAPRPEPAEAVAPGPAVSEWPSHQPVPERAEDVPAPSPVVSEQPTEQVAPAPFDQATPSKLDGAMAVIDETEGQLGDVEAALERLESGNYRVCEICGVPLDMAALAVAPTLRRCLVHAS